MTIQEFKSKYGSHQMDMMIRHLICYVPAHQNPFAIEIMEMSKNLESALRELDDRKP